MKIDKNLRLNSLFDAYGPLLSKSQQQILGQMLEFDLTVSEIAENRGTTRQAVMDAVSKAEQKLEKYESKLHFLEKLAKKG